jgi:ribosomal protein L7/L12
MKAIHNIKFSGTAHELQTLLVRSFDPESRVVEANITIEIEMKSKRTPELDALIALAPDVAYVGQLEEKFEIARAFATAGNKIQAIKQIRTISDLGLKDSKDFVEKVWPS